MVRPATKEQENGKFPAIFLLHGYEKDKEELFSMANELPQEYTIISVQAPYKLSDTEFFWYAIELVSSKWCDIVQAQATQYKLLTFIEECCKKYCLNTDKITLLGFDQGGILGLSLAISYPEKVQKVVALNSFIDKKLLIFGYQKNNFEKLKVCMLHGFSNSVIPIEWAQETISFLKSLHIANYFEIFPCGHNISPEMFYSFKKWIEEEL